MLVNKNVIVLTPLMNTSIREFTICLPKYMSLAIYYQNYRYILYILCLIETILSIHAKVPGAQKLFLWLTISMKKKLLKSSSICFMQSTKNLCRQLEHIKQLENTFTKLRGDVIWGLSERLWGNSSYFFSRGNLKDNYNIYLITLILLV